MNKRGGKRGKVQVSYVYTIGSYLHKASEGFKHFIKSKHTANRADGRLLRHEAVGFFI